MTSSDSTIRARGHAVLRVPLVDAHRARGSARSSPAAAVLRGRKTVSSCPSCTSWPGFDVEVDLVEVRQEHLVLCRPGDVAPDSRPCRRGSSPGRAGRSCRSAPGAAGRSSDMPFASRRTCAPLAARGRAVGAALSQADLVARVDPVRVLDLRVVRPDARPLVRVLEVVVAEAPERVAAPDDVRVGDLAAGVRSGPPTKMGPFSPPCAAPPPPPRRARSSRGRTSLPASPVTGCALDSVALPPPMVPLGDCGLP